MAIRRIFLSDSDTYKNQFKKETNFPRIAESRNFSGLRIFGFGFQILAIFKDFIINKNYVLNSTFFVFSTTMC